MTSKDISFGLRNGNFPTADESHMFIRKEFTHVGLRDLTGPLIKYAIEK